MKFKIHFRNDEVRELYKNAGVKTDGSAGFDLVTVEDADFDKSNDFTLIDLGVVIEVPKGYHAILMPRSSTFKKYGLIQANGIGLIDHDYKGPEDWWMLPTFFAQKNLGKVSIPKGTRICQFMLMKTVKIDSYEEFIPEGPSRDGIGSTGN